MPGDNYVTSTGTLAPQPITTRLGTWAGDQFELAYLFFETLMSVGFPSHSALHRRLNGRVAAIQSLFLDGPLSSAARSPR